MQNLNETTPAYTWTAVDVNGVILSVIRQPITTAKWVWILDNHFPDPVIILTANLIEIPRRWAEHTCECICESISTDD